MSRLHLLVSATLAALVGCTSTPEQPAVTAPVVTAAPAAPAVAAPPAPGGAAAPAAPSAQPAQTTQRSVALHPLDDANSALARRSVYFDFDSALLGPEDQPVIEAHSKYLASSRTAKVRIEGNCDERGGREYNLALGQRRAQAVLKSLQLMGVPSDEMEATSYGEEKPADPGHDETAWAKNRRADLNYLRR